MPRPKEHARVSIPVEILPKGGGPNPLNPYDKLSPAERGAKVVEIMAGIYARVKGTKSSESEPAA